MPTPCLSSAVVVPSDVSFVCACGCVGVGLVQLQVIKGRLAEKGDQGTQREHDDLKVAHTQGLDTRATT